MNHFNDAFYPHSHHLNQPTSALLFSAGHRLLAAKLAAAAAMTNGSASAGSPVVSSASSGKGQGFSAPCSTTPSSTTALSNSSTNSILYSAISAKSTFAIPQAPPPLVSASGGSGLPSAYYSRSSVPAAQANPSLVNCSGSARGGHSTGSQRQQATAVIPPSVVILDSDGHVSTTTTVTSTTSTRGRGRGRGGSQSANPVGRPPKRPYHRTNFSGLSRVPPPPPPTAPQMAAVSAAHQNESHNSLAASMPLLSTYLMKGTISGYHNGHLMNKGPGCYSSSGSSSQSNAAKVEPTPPPAIVGFSASSTSFSTHSTNSAKQGQDESPADDEDESVRFGRVPKREKAKILAAMQKVNAHSLDKALSHVLEDEHTISATIAKAHEETCDYTREKVAPLLDAARSRPVYAQCPPQMTCPLNPIPAGAMDPGTQTARILEDFSERFSPAIRGVVEFAKRIPGFGMLSQEDQVTLLKAGVFEVLLVRLACMFDSQTSSMVCLNGLVLRRDALHSASNARFLLDSMFDFAERLNSLRLSDHEIGLFCAVVVIAPDRPGIRNIDLVQKINKRLEEVLQKTIASNHPNDVASGNLIFSELTKKIPDLRTLNTLHSEKLLGKSFGVTLGEQQASSTTSVLAAATSPLLLHPQSPMDNSATSSVLSQCPMQSAAASLIVQQHHQSLHQSQPQPDSSDNSPSDRWSSSSSLGHFSPATSTEDGRSVSPTSGPWNEHHSKEGGFGSPRSMSSSSGVSSEDSHSRKGSISLPSAPPKLAYINSYVRGLSSPVVVSSEHHAAMPASSVDESAYQHHLHPYSKLSAHLTSGQHARVDSPTDSGIEHSGHSTTPTTSVCSSPARSAAAADEAKKLVIATSPRSDVMTSDSEGSEKQESIDDMPVLKRALQAPPLVNTNKLMDEAYRHHKKFRAAARRDTEPHSPSTTTGANGGTTRLPESPSSALSTSISSSLASTHSTLLKTLEQPSRYLSEQQLKRTDLIHNIIMSTEAVTTAALPAPQITIQATNGQNVQQPQLSPFQAQLFTSAHHTPVGGQQQQQQAVSPQPQQQPSKDNLTVMYPSGYYHHIPAASTPAVCPFTGRSSSSSPSQFQLPAHYAKSPEVAAAAAGLLVIGNSVPPAPATVASAPATPSSRSISPLHQAPSPYSHLQRCLTATTAPLALHGPSLMPPTTAATQDLDEEDAQPLNLSKKPSPPPSVAMPSPAASPAASSSSSSLKMDVD